jgi:hypothetical protein
MTNSRVSAVLSTSLLMGVAVIPDSRCIIEHLQREIFTGSETYPFVKLEANRTGGPTTSMRG